MQEIKSINPVIHKDAPDHVTDSVALLFHENTKIRPYHFPREPGNLKKEKFIEESGQRYERLYRIVCKSYKRYAHLPAIDLPKEFAEGPLSLEQVIKKRKSHRIYTGDPLTLHEVSRLLYYSYGTTHRSYLQDGTQLAFRASPSGGGLYPLEIYPVVLSAGEIPPGVYHYYVKAHQLECLQTGDFRERLHTCCLDQEFLETVSTVFVITGVFHRHRFKYGERGYRFTLLDAGHLAEHFYLVGTSLGLGACGIGGFVDEEINALVDVDGVTEAALYLVGIGRIP